MSSLSVNIAIMCRHEDRLQSRTKRPLIVTCDIHINLKAIFTYLICVFQGINGILNRFLVVEVMVVTSNDVVTVGVLHYSQYFLKLWPHSTAHKYNPNMNQVTPSSVQLWKMIMQYTPFHCVSQLKCKCTTRYADTVTHVIHCTHRHTHPTSRTS